MPVYTDQTGSIVSITSSPRRIISVVPSQTELLFYLGLTTEVAGITKFCVHPEQWFREKTRVGGTKTLNIDLIRQLGPDLVIANKEENVKEQIEELKRAMPVYVTDVNDLEDAVEMIKAIGTIVNKSERAGLLVKEIQKTFDDLGKTVASLNSHPRTAYLIWKDPYMSVGNDTFIHDLISRCGWNNIFSDLSRYPTIEVEELRKRKCELLLLSSEPFPFRQQHVDELKQLLPDCEIKTVDGEMFSWYGSRLRLSAAYLKNILLTYNFTS